MSTPGNINFGTSLDDIVSLVEATNNASTTLTAGINASVLSIPIADPGEFPSSGIITLTDSIAPWTTTPTKVELVIYTSKSGSNLIVPSGGRGVFGTTAQSWTSGQYVEMRPTAQHHSTIRDSLIAVQTALNSALITLTWGTPGPESSNAIEVTGSCSGFAGSTFASSIVDVQITVTDAANDSSPSHTATLSAANTPVGTLLDGSGTATAIFRTDSNGQFKIKITEISASDRYLWVSTGGHSRLWIRSSIGVLQLTFT